MLGASAVPGGVHAPLHGVRLLSESFLAEESERRWRTTEEQMAGALLIKIQKAAVKIIIKKNAQFLSKMCSRPHPTCYYRSLFLWKKWGRR